MEKVARTADKIQSWREIRGHGTRLSHRGPRGSNLVPPAASRANFEARSPHKNWVERCLRCLPGLPWGTGSSNPSPSSEESAANPESLDQAVLISGGPQLKRRRVPAPGPDRPHVIASDDRAAVPKSKQSKLRVQPGRRLGQPELCRRPRPARTDVPLRRSTGRGDRAGGKWYPPHPQ